MKQCSRCKQTKKLTEFSRSRSSSDGRNHKCDECNREASKEHYEKSNGTKQERAEQQANLLNYIKNLKSKGRTLKEIGDAVGLDESTISYYLSGQRKVGTRAVKKFLERVSGP